MPTANGVAGGESTWTCGAWCCCQETRACADVQRGSGPRHAAACSAFDPPPTLDPQAAPTLHACAHASHDDPPRKSRKRSPHKSLNHALYKAYKHSPHKSHHPPH
eukprot:364948-Chlamydomonas_euryale.AAC.16